MGVYDLLDGNFIGKDSRSITFQCDVADYGVDFYFDIGSNISCEDFPIKITGPSQQIYDKCDDYQEVEDHGTKLRLKTPSSSAKLVLMKPIAHQVITWRVRLIQSGHMSISTRQAPCSGLSAFSG